MPTMPADNRLRSGISRNPQLMIRLSGEKQQGNHILGREISELWNQSCFVMIDEGLTTLLTLTE